VCLVALVNNVGEAHLEGFGSVRGVLQAKMEIYESLASDGVAVVNADSPFYSDIKDKTRHLKTLTFSGSLENKQGQSESAAVQLLQVEALSLSAFLYRVEVQTPLGIFSFSTRLMGRHNIQNALAAIACVLPFVSDVAVIIRGLENVRAVPGRLCYEKISDNLYLVDDTYNANPLSMQAALAAFDELVSGSYVGFEKIFVVGDMFELGPHSENAHRDLGHQANHYGIDTMIAVGACANTTISAFAKEKYAFESHDAAHALLAEKRTAKAFFLIKGSRGARMEKIVQRLKA
jgi:UDP-N-acetylmuramoyl-tripeptide--D-alanyl-D-alanine ligase